MHNLSYLLPFYDYCLLVDCLNNNNNNKVDVVPVVVGALGGLVWETPQCIRTVQGGDLAIVQQEAIQGSVKILRPVHNM